MEPAKYKTLPDERMFDSFEIALIFETLGPALSLMVSLLIVCFARRSLDRIMSFISLLNRCVLLASSNFSMFSLFLPVSALK